YGQLGLDLLARGMTPQQALDFMVRGDEGRENRQVAILTCKDVAPHGPARTREIGRATVARRTTASREISSLGRESLTAWSRPLKRPKVSRSPSVCSPRSTGARPQAVIAAACR